MNKFWRYGLAACGLCVAMAVTAQAQMSADATISARQEAMKGQGGAMRTLTPLVRGEQPWNQAAVVQAATTLTNTAKVIPSVFPEGTGPDKGKTDALPAIWQNKADFDSEARRSRMRARGCCSWPRQATKPAPRRSSPMSVALAAAVMRRTGSRSRRADGGDL